MGGPSECRSGPFHLLSTAAPQPFCNRQHLPDNRSANRRQPILRVVLWEQPSPPLKRTPGQGIPTPILSGLSGLLVRDEIATGQEARSAPSSPRALLTRGGVGGPLKEPRGSHDPHDDADGRRGAAAPLYGSSGQGLSARVWVRAVGAAGAGAWSDGVGE